MLISISLSDSKNTFLLYFPGLLGTVEGRGVRVMLPGSLSLRVILPRLQGTGAAWKEQGSRTLIIGRSREAGH